MTAGNDVTQRADLTHGDTLPVTYSSDDTNVAIVDETTGAVTIIGEGRVTITATFAGNDDYEEGSASYRIRVKTWTNEDVDELANYIMTGYSSEFYNEAEADFNGDGKVNVADIVELVNMINNHKE